MNNFTKAVLGVLAVLTPLLGTDAVQHFIAATVAPLIATHPAISALVLFVVKAGLTLVDPNKKVAA